jgi:predicted HD superfamily hydrolase involved in NAD metabolism
MNMADYEGYLKKQLTPQRFGHSLGVMNTMEELSAVYNLNQDQAMLAGLLHDAAKELPPGEWMSLASRDEQLLRDSQLYDYHRYLHGPVGAIMILRDLHIEDEEIRGAIATHGYYGPWEAFNRPLSWCLRMSDILEPGRDWRDNRWLKDLVAPLREATYGGQLTEAALMITQRLMAWYEAEGVAIHPNIRGVANSLSLMNS